MGNLQHMARAGEHSASSEGLLLPNLCCQYSPLNDVLAVPSLQQVEHQIVDVLLVHHINRLRERAVE